MFPYWDRPSDFFWFLVSPITTVPMAAYTIGFYVAGEEHPYGKPDWRKNLANAGIWGAAALGNWAYHAYMHPGKYSWTKPADAFKLVGHLAANPLVIATTGATAAAVAWAATGDLHGAVPPGTGMGMPMTPDLYSQGTSNNPAGWDFGSWLEELF